ncbi:hypothetical protein GH714_043200 [Hevea brasiliensis]|uniref:(+)-neomenthol dehydrogenase-like n=1 Tax=Hevea brasiliensis TaxID=3981 RepID=A0A6A6K170_HEVBR|nr:hypothetical protein GH714_043200 [Hevea brasiliensis]
MAEATKSGSGANKGVGFEICMQLASNGIVVVLTATDEKRGLEALQKLKDSSLSDLVVFHQLDVADAAVVVALADFIRTQFGKLDGLVSLKPTYHFFKHVANEWAKEVLIDADNLSEGRIDEALSKCQEDLKESSPETKGWPAYLSAHMLSKAAMNACTRILAKKVLTFRVNCVCPGFVKTDINYNNGMLSVEEGAANPVRLALLPNDGPSGCFFDQKEESPFLLNMIPLYRQ